MKPDFLPVPGLFKSPNFSHVAVVPSGATWVLIGGQSGVNAQGELVGKGDAVAQSTQIRKNIDAALQAAGCDWSNVVRVTVRLKTGVRPQDGFGPFASALKDLPAPPLVIAGVVDALSLPEALAEVSVEACR